MPNESNVVIVTTTFYKSKDELRFELACKMVKQATASGYPVVIIDCSPNPDIGGALRSLGASVYPQLHEKMGPGRRQAFFHASELAGSLGINTLLWSEPEKPIVPFIPEIVAPIEAGAVDIVIPRRSKASWKTWPKFQQASERQANDVYNEAFGWNGFDPMFGPVAFNISQAGYFAVNNRFSGIDDTYIQHYAPLLARFQGNARLATVEIDMVYPPKQRIQEECVMNEEMLKKREWQLRILSEAYGKLAALLR